MRSRSAQLTYRWIHSRMAGVLSGFLAVGRMVGRDICVVGFDDIEECRMSYPQLSSVRCDISGFGRQTATKMLAWLDEGRRPLPETRAPVSLVARASSLGS